MGSGASQPVSTPAVGRQHPAILGSYQIGQVAQSTPQTGLYPTQHHGHGGYQHQQRLSYQNQQHLPSHNQQHIGFSHYNIQSVSPHGQQQTIAQQQLPVHSDVSTSPEVTRPSGLYPTPSDEPTVPPRESSPPPPPAQQHTNYGRDADHRSYDDWVQPSNALLQSYGEQDYDLQEMTWPLPQNDNDALLTDEDIREGERFILEMEEKRVLYESMQAELLRRLRMDRQTDEKEIFETCDLITNLCQAHHFLYGGHEDELGIEFEPSANTGEDEYILEQIDELSQRHHQDLVRSDCLCAQKLLEGRGDRMSPQKLDSILEEHIKLRGYMRTRQTKEQIAAYQQVQSAIRDNPALFQSFSGQSGIAGQSKLVVAENSRQIAVSRGEHPIASRLPQLSQAKIKSIGAVRGRTVVVDAEGQVINNTPATQHSNDQNVSSANPSLHGQTDLKESPSVNTLSDTEQSTSNNSRFTNSLDSKANQLNANSIWAKMPSVDEDSEFSRRAEPKRSEAVYMPEKAEEQRAVPAGMSGFAVITADPRYVRVDPAAHFGAANQATAYSSDDDETADSSGLERTGIITGTVSDRVSRYSETADQRVIPNNGLRKTHAATDYSMEAAAYEEDFENFDDDDDGEDLVAHYQRTLGVDGDESEDDDYSRESFEKPDSRNSSATSGRNSNGAGSQLMASAKLKDELCDAIWDHQQEIDPQSFHELVSMWQNKQQDIIMKEDEGEISTPSNAKALWQMVKEKVMYEAIRAGGARTASDDDDGDDDFVTNVKSQNTSMQTSLTRNQSASIQTDMESNGVDAATLVDEFLIDDQEKKKIKKLDKQMIEKLVSGELSDDEFNKLMARNRENVEKLRKQKEANRLKSLQLLQEKRAKRGQCDEDSDEETATKLGQIEQKVAKKLTKHRDSISEKDMKRLLNDARKQQDEILRQRNIEKLRQNDKMRQMLLEKRSAKKRQEEAGQSGETKFSDLEARFYKDLQAKLASGTLTQEQFRTLMEKHLSKIGGASGFSKRGGSSASQQVDDPDDSREEQAKRAHSIIKRGHEKNKAIQDVRQRERENALAELKQKRKMRKGKSAL